MKIPLLGGFYTNKSIISGCQKCLNLFPENNPEGSSLPVPVTTYLTPGLALLATATNGEVRCLYRASNGNLFAVINQTVYFVDSGWGLNVVGTIGTAATPVYMIDNGLVIVLVDGSTKGYAIDMVTLNFGMVSSTNFYGATRVDYLDTFFIFNRPNTNQFYISLSVVTYAMLIAGTAFDPTDIAAKSGYPDNIVTLIVIQGYIWLIGEVSTEVWYNAGATQTGTANFVFNRLPGVNIIQHGTIAPYSVAAHDLFPYWLARDMQGQLIVMKGKNYQPTRISTHAIEYQLSTYSTTSDCISYIYQQEGHTFLVLNFPTANVTWVYDEATELWHERGYTDNNGVINRHRSNCAANAYGEIVVGDWTNGNIYAYRANVYTDNGQPITRVRSFPHLVKGGNRLAYSQFIADMAVGNDDGLQESSMDTVPPVVSLQWSDDRGVTYGNAITQSLGATGEYLTSIQFQRLGYARDRVFQLSWSAPVNTALQGAWIRVEEAET